MYHLLPIFLHVYAAHRLCKTADAMIFVLHVSGARAGEKFISVNSPHDVGKTTALMPRAAAFERSVRSSGINRRLDMFASPNLAQRLVHLFSFPFLASSQWAGVH